MLTKLISQETRLKKVQDHEKRISTKVAPKLQQCYTKVEPLHHSCTKVSSKLHQSETKVALKLHMSTEVAPKFHKICTKLVQKLHQTLKFGKDIPSSNAMIRQTQKNFYKMVISFQTWILHQIYSLDQESKNYFSLVLKYLNKVNKIMEYQWITFVSCCQSLLI